MAVWYRDLNYRRRAVWANDGSEHRDMPGKSGRVCAVCVQLGLVPTKPPPVNSENLCSV